AVYRSEAFSSQVRFRFRAAMFHLLRAGKRSSLAKLAKPQKPEVHSQIEKPSGLERLGGQIQKRQREFSPTWVLSTSNAPPKNSRRMILRLRCSTRPLSGDIILTQRTSTITPERAKIQLRYVTKKISERRLGSPVEDMNAGQTAAEGEVKAIAPRDRREHEGFQDSSEG